MAIFGPKPRVNPFEKCQFFDFLKFSFFWPRKAIFIVLEYRKRTFPGLYYLKKRSWKNGLFWTKTIG